MDKGNLFALMWNQCAKKESPEEMARLQAEGCGFVSQEELARRQAEACGFYPNAMLKQSAQTEKGK